MKKSVGRAVIVAAVLSVAGLAHAFSSLLIGSVGVSGTDLVIATNEMPKGWFSTKNLLERTKSSVVLSVNYGATSCSDASTDGANSRNHGDFSEALNASGQVNGWFWDHTVAMAAAQNRWHKEYACDGSFNISGCEQPVSVTVTLAAFTKSGACHTYAAGGCVTETQVLTLAAVEEPSVPASNCADDSCKKACHAACEAAHSGSDFGHCRANCNDTCKGN